MRDQIKRILSEVAESSAEWANRHKKALGGVGAAGVAGALGTDSGMDMARKGISLGKRVMRLSDAVEKAEAPDDPQSINIHPSIAMYGYRFSEPDGHPYEMHWDGLREKH